MSVSQRLVRKGEAPAVLSSHWAAAATKDKDMWQQPENDQFADELFLADELVPRGIYRQIGSRRGVQFTSEDYLPASLDGHVATYVRVRAWGQMTPILAEREN